MYNYNMTKSAHPVGPKHDERPKRSYAGMPTLEREASRRKQFIDAGIELFGTVGYHATTVRALTMHAGLTNRYFYEAFETTEDLLVACYEQLMQDYRERLNQTVKDAGDVFEARIRAGLTCFFEAMLDGRFARIAFSEVLGVSARVDRMYAQSIEEFAELIMGYIEPEPAKVTVSENDDLEMRLIGAALAGAVIRAGLTWRQSVSQVPIEQVVTASMKVILGTAQQLSAATPTAPAKVHVARRH